MVAVSRGDVVRVRLDPTVGSELQKTRPCVVVQRDAANRVQRTTIVCPLTAAAGKAPSAIRIFIPAGSGGTTKDSLAVCSQVRVVGFERIVDHIGRLPSDVMDRLSAGLRMILDLDPIGSA